MYICACVYPPRLPSRCCVGRYPHPCLVTPSVRPPARLVSHHINQLRLASNRPRPRPRPRPASIGPRSAPHRLDSTRLDPHLFLPVLASVRPSVSDIHHAHPRSRSDPIHPSRSLIHLYTSNAQSTRTCPTIDSTMPTQPCLALSSRGRGHHTALSSPSQSTIPLQVSPSSPVSAATHPSLH